ncbi:DNA gyrase subunit A [Sporocytophaga myxococcoides]|uniref:DNA gyrase subunit A n=1 Tax=Sporocytophaga myxococcoides TaxID=153721 RepID=A0A098LJK1_9BACT|nr:DNA gyrase subunit A [Sporocytophaga myxococcoides]GAL86664.1 DNA gyrase subunit A [Sporocytophaga myxococcoides]
MAEGENIIPINIEDEMRGAYIDYSMSVIISRALPDVRDGLKPVHRRVLFGMSELGVNWNKPYKKSARIVGEVLGKFHPHGDASVYDSMVRMAQPWSLRYMMVDGQGNFGSIDGDSPAAMRYTEARFKRIAEEMLSDINKNTVDFQPNFDDSLEEPTVLPSKVPNLLINGTSGIAVGMATNMAPHNLREVVDGVCAYIDNNDITIEELMEFVKAPDFPTGGTIYGYQGVKSAFETGRGRVVVRANATFENTPTGRDMIVVHDIPYMVNKASMVEKTAQLINEKKIEGISDIRDESDREGLRIVYELKKDAIPSIVLNNLYKYTQLQSSFGVNNVALVNGRPMTVNLKDMIRHFVDHRHEVIVRRTKFELEEAEKRAHILQGYLIALDHLDEVIKLIRNSRDPEEAKKGLMENFGMSEIQAKAVLELRLQRLTGMERDKIVKEYEEVMALIARLNEILNSVELRMQIIKNESLEMKERYGDERRTQIVHSADDIDIEDIIADDEMVITISHEGYIKRTPLTEYRSQSRGGVGSRGAVSKEDDFTEHLFIATMHNYLLIFTDSGKVFWQKVYGIPEGSKTSKGRPIQNLINVEKEDKVRAIINVKTLENVDYINNNFIIMVTENGTIKKTSLEAFSRPRSNGIQAITINEGDKLLNVRLTNGSNEIVIALKSGRAIRFNEEHVRPMGRNAAGVRGVTLADDEDKVIGMVCLSCSDNNLLVVSEKGYGKRSDIDDYRVTNRGGKGVKTLNITEKTGKLVAIMDVSDKDELMIINKSGITIRMPVSDLRVVGRATQGVRLIKLSETDEIASIAKIENLATDENLSESTEPTTEIPDIEAQLPNPEAPEESQSEEEENDNE